MMTDYFDHDNFVHFSEDFDQAYGKPKVEEVVVA